MLHVGGAARGVHACIGLHYTLTPSVDCKKGG